MKIGILSMQRIPNYGSFLQSFALKKLMEQRGHTVTYVDIERKKGHCPPKKSKLQQKLEKLKYVDKYFFRRMKDSEKNKQMSVMFREVQNSYLGLTSENMASDGCDAVIIGSDEIFNCSPDSFWGITGQRFGDIPGVPVVMSYAASCGYTGLDDMSTGDKAVVKSALRKLSAVSVRDENTRALVKKLTGVEPEQNLDPVLIYGFEDEIALGEKQGVPSYPYMVVYAYHNRIDSKKEINAIINYAKKHNLKTIAIGGSLPWCDEFAVISPFQVLAYFKHAECIVTDTFHGTVMAAKLNRPFGAFVRDSNKNKLDDLLNRLGIDSHKVSNPDMLERTLDIKYDYASFNAFVESERDHALGYFEKAGL